MKTRAETPSAMVRGECTLAGSASFTPTSAPRSQVQLMRQSDTRVPSACQLSSACRSGRSSLSNRTSSASVRVCVASALAPDRSGRGSHRGAHQLPTLMLGSGSMKTKAWEPPQEGTDWPHLPHMPIASRQRGPNPVESEPRAASTVPRNAEGL